MIVLKAPKGGSVVVFVACMVLAVVGALLVLPNLPWLGRTPAALRIAGGAVLVVCPVVGGLFLRKSLSSPIALVIDRKGILDASAAGIIGWDEIVRVGVVTVDGKKAVGIAVRDPQTAKDRAETTRLLKKVDEAQLGFSLTIPQHLLDRPAEKVAAILERYLKDRDARRELRKYGD